MLLPPAAVTRGPESLAKLKSLLQAAALAGNHGFVAVTVPEILLCVSYLMAPEIALAQGFRMWVAALDNLSYSISSPPGSFIMALHTFTCRPPKVFYIALARRSSSRNGGHHVHMVQQVSPTCTLAVLSKLPFKGHRTFSSQDSCVMHGAFCT